MSTNSNFNFKDKTVSWLSHLYNGNTHTWKDHLFIETGPCQLAAIVTGIQNTEAKCFTVFSVFGIASWWRYQMETFSTLLALCEGNPPVSGGYPSQRPVTQSFDVFFDLRLNKQLSKQWKCQWFEMPSRSLWHHIMIITVQNWHIYILFSDRIICSSYKQMFDISGKMILGSSEI